MRRNYLNTIATVVLLVGMTFSNFGCSTAVSAYNNRELSVQAKMSETVFLDPATLEKDRKIYIRFTNTSDFQDINIGDLLKARIASEGFTVVKKPSEAQYILQANLLYLGEKKESLTMEGMLSGGFGGGLVGTALTAGTDHSFAGTTAGTLAGMAAGAALGSMVHVDEYLGALDIQIQEPVKGGVKGKRTVEKLNGTGARGEGGLAGQTLQTDYKSDRYDHRTRIVVSAVQTNIDRAVAVKEIAGRFVTQVAGVFAN